MAEARLRIHVTPRSGRDEVVGWRGDELAVRVTVPPEDGKANEAVRKIVGESLGVPKSAVTIRRGKTSRHKAVTVEGVNARDIEGVFGTPA